MSRSAIVVALLLLAAAPVLAGPEWSKWESALADHPLRSSRGEVLRLEELRGEVVVVNFWATWCKPCRRELADLDEWAGVRADAARVLAVSIDREPARVERFVDETNLALPVFLDGPDGLAESLDLPGLPCTVVVDREGRVVKVQTGGKKESVRELERFVDAMTMEVDG